jgi:hypothetical protein
VSRVVRESLAAAFAPNSPQRSQDSDRNESSDAHRAAALAGLLPERGQHASRVPPTPVPPPVLERPAARGSGDVIDEPSEERDTGDLGRVRNVAVYLPLDLLERLRTTARSREMTYAELLTEAASAHLATVASSFAPAPPPQLDGGMPTRARRRSVEPGVQRQMRLDGHQIAWLDQQGPSPRTWWMRASPRDPVSACYALRAGVVSPVFVCSVGVSGTSVMRARARTSRPR